jgi:hypothetical protein
VAGPTITEKMPSGVVVVDHSRTVLDHAGAMRGDGRVDRRERALLRAEAGGDVYVRALTDLVGELSTRC